MPIVGDYRVLDVSGSSVRLVRAVSARSGEGFVYDTNLPGRVAKIYHTPPTNHTVNKLRHMIAHPPDDPERGRGHASIAWPEQLLRHNGQVVGFTMPKAPPGRQLVVAMSPKQRRQWAPDFLWDALVLAARNTATAFEQVHAKGHVIGDVKPENILVSTEARVTLVDNDSFQVVESSGVVHYCQVYTPGFLPVELFGRDLKTTRRTAAHDAFGLGVLTYKLLMCGAHPFVGGWRGRGEEPAQDDDCVRLGSFVHLASSPMVPRPTVLPLEALPQEVQALFFRCFAQGQTDPSARPSARDWRLAMEVLLRSLTRCGTYPTRHFHYHGASCPWCALLHGQQVDYFDARSQRTVVSQPPVTPHPKPAPPRVVVPRKKPNYLAYAAAILVVVLALVISYALRPGPSRPPAPAAVQESSTPSVPVVPVVAPPAPETVPSEPPVAQPQPSVSEVQAQPEKVGRARMVPPDLVAVGSPTQVPLEGLASGSREAQERQRLVASELGLPVEVKTAKTGIVFCLIPAGTFAMGSPSSEAQRSSDETEHQVTLTKAFYCGKFEVTQGQWQQVMGTNPSSFQNAGANAPVETVSWEDCQAFLKKLCQTEGVPEGTYRLLTEAEWEYACRAGTQTPFAYGNDLDSSMANFNGNYPYGAGRKGQYRQTTVAVGSFRPNAWGLYDMHGNVWEWCQDWYANYASGSVTDPLGPASGVGRVHRGGSWLHLGGRCRSAGRYWFTPGPRNHYVGLRLARTTASYP